MEILLNKHKESGKVDACYYRVALTDGWIVDDTGKYLRDAIRLDCGHNHKTEKTAESCRQKLMNWSKDSRECSAKWYNSQILRTDRIGRHAPQTVAEVCG